MLSESRFIRACLRQPTDATPVWFMRQAGRYMPQYRAVRSNITMLDAIRSPQIAHEITMQPIDAFDLDAAIIFADILTPLIGMGIELDFIKGEGPQIENPLRRTLDIDRLGTPAAQEALPFALEAIKMTVDALTPRNIPLIGFSGAPFTLASYAIEGGGSKNYELTKGLMWAEPAAWKRLMTKLVTVLGDLLTQQVAAGASVLQIFDSWVGVLGPRDFTRYVAPYTRQLIEIARKTGVPVIYFSTGTGTMFDQVAALGSDVISIDWRVNLDTAWSQIGPEQAIQGNLDPVALLSPWPEVQAQTDEILRQAAGRPGHIFNLGHGILPPTPVDTVRRLAQYVHEKTARTE